MLHPITAAPAFVDADFVRAHLALLAAQGIGYRRVAELAGLTVESVRVIVAGRRGATRRGQMPARVRWQTARGILSVPASVDSLAIVPATGARRRVQALICNGWSQNKLADRLGLSQRQFGRVLRQDSIRATTHATICGLYEQLWNTLPPLDTEHDRAASERCRGYARALGWLPPLAWDDIDADEPAQDTAPVFLDEIAIELAVLGEKPALNRLERMSAVLILNRDHHLSDAEISEVLGLHKDSVNRYRRDSRTPPAVNSSKQVVNA